MTDEERLAVLDAVLTPPIDALQVMASLDSMGVTLYRKRQYTNGRRPNASQPMNPALARAIRRAFAANPHMTQAQLAARFNVNPGRVAEALQGRHG